MADSEAAFEAAAEAIWNAEFLLIVAGPCFSEDSSRTPYASDHLDISLAHTAPNKFMWFWGKFYNDYLDRAPHEGFHILSKWRERYFDVRSDDQRKRQQRKKGDDEAGPMVGRCMAVTTACDNFFQKVNFPAEEVYDMWGNITMWQCSLVPPCCQKVWNVPQMDRHFRFVIDQATQEAAAVKYEADRRDTTQRITWQAYDSDEEVETGFVPATATGAVALEPRSGIKGAPQQPQQTQAGKQNTLVWLDRATAIPVHRETQFNGDSYKDYFVGFAQNVGQALEEATFVVEPEDEADGGDTDVTTSTPQEGKVETEEAEEEDAVKKPPPPPPLGPLCPLPVRCSHLYAHVEALDLDTHSYEEGRFRLVDADILQKERKFYNSSVNKLFDPHVAHIAFKRGKYISFNISIVVLDNDAPENSPAAVAAATSAGANSSLRSTVVDPAVLEQLRMMQTTVMTDPETGEQRAVPIEMEPWDRERWHQGAGGRFYFSNVKLTTTLREPETESEYDVITIPVPGECDFRVPYNGRVSVVCETIVNEHERVKVDTDKDRRGPAHPADGSVNPYTYTKNVWQMFGSIEGQTPDKCLIVPGDSPTLEYMLYTRKFHGLRFGTDRKNNTRRVNYITVDSPALEATPHTVGLGSLRTLTAAELDARAGLLAATTRPTSGGVSSSNTAMQSVYGHHTRDDKPKPPRPVPNHLMCVECHGIARPHVLMSAGGRRDDGICQTAVSTRQKQFKTWEKAMLEIVKQDSSRALVILELGCEKRTEPCKTYSERIFKQTKSQRSTFIRISTQNLETKKSSGGGGDKADNYIVIVDTVVHALNQIDKIFLQKKKMN
eukprot:PhM_4_TR10386/c0_g1_i2/m.31074